MCPFYIFNLELQKINLSLAGKVEDDGDQDGPREGERQVNGGADAAHNGHLGDMEEKRLQSRRKRSQSRHIGLDWLDCHPQ